MEEILDQTHDSKQRNYYKKSRKNGSKIESNLNIKVNSRSKKVTKQLPLITSKLSKESSKKYVDYSKKNAIDSISNYDEIISTVIPEIAKDIVDLERLKTDFSNQLKMTTIFDLDLFDPTIDIEVKESKLQYIVEEQKLSNIRIAAVDGSFVKQSFYGLDIYLSRAIGVIYQYNIEDKKPIITYYPDEKGLDNHKLNVIMKNLSEEEASLKISIDRAKMEIDLVIEMIDRSIRTNNKIDLFILDGSILAQPLNLLFNSKNMISDNYYSLIDKYNKLYEICEFHDIILVGAIKDTRISTFKDILSRRLPRIIAKHEKLEPIIKTNYRKLISYLSDIELFHRIMDPGYRSCVFSLNSSQNSWIPRQLNALEQEMKNQNNGFSNFEFYATYLKSVKYDFPMKIEFLMGKDNANNIAISKKASKIASIIYQLSNKYEKNSIPYPQLEAHLRCKLSNQDMNIIRRMLERKISEELQKYSQEQLYNSDHNLEENKIDELLLKNKLLITKRRDRLPI